MPRDRGGDRRGAITAEAALVLPVLVATTLALVWLLSLAAGQTRVVDAARETARAAARGDPVDVAIGRGLAVAPRASIEVTDDGDHVRVTVHSQVAGPGGLLAHLPGADLHAEAVAVREPG